MTWEYVILSAQYYSFNNLESHHLAKINLIISNFGHRKNWTFQTYFGLVLHEDSCASKFDSTYFGQSKVSPF